MAEGYPLSASINDLHRIADTQQLGEDDEEKPTTLRLAFLGVLLGGLMGFVMFGILYTLLRCLMFPHERQIGGRRQGDRDIQVVW